MFRLVLSLAAGVGLESGLAPPGFLSSLSSIFDIGIPLVIVEIWILRSEILSRSSLTSLSTISRL